MLKWGIIGTGDVAYDVAYAIRFLPGNELTAVASRTKKNAETFAAVNQIPHVYDDFKALIASGETDIIYIATPNASHYPLMKYCLENKQHVLCEKPFTLNAKQAKEIQELTKQSGKFCMEAMWTRFIPSVLKVRELLNNNVIGEIKMIQGSFGGKLNKQRCFDLNQGGGSLLDLGVYLISLSFFLLGKPDEVSASASFSESGVDEQAGISLKYKSGALASLTCSFKADLENEFTLFGTRGMIKIGAPFYRSSILRIVQTPESTAENQNATAGVRRNPYALPGLMKKLPFIAENIRAIKGGNSKKVVVPFTGNGYHYEIQEVNHCIKNNQQESRMMSLNDTVMVMEVMDEIRRQWNLRYPNE